MSLVTVLLVALCALLASIRQVSACEILPTAPCAEPAPINQVQG